MTQIHSVLITGANRGIGLQFVREFLKLKQAPKIIIATARQPSKSTELQQLASEHNGVVYVLKLDVRDYASYDNFAASVEEIVGEQGLQLLINNAGIYNKDVKDVTAADMLDTFETNAVTPLMLSHTLIQLMRKSASAGQRTIVANITSKMGSIDDNTSGGQYAYRASKSALNQITKSMSVDFKKDNIECVAVHPGWVKTDMGGPNAIITTEKSAGEMTRVLTDGRELNGKFLNYDGAPINW